jgi:hypothetical protein
MTVNNEWKMTWKEVVAAYLSHYLDIRLEELRKITKISARLFGVQQRFESGTSQIIVTSLAA